MTADIIPLSWFRRAKQMLAASITPPEPDCCPEYVRAKRAYDDAEARQDTRAMHHAAADLRAAMRKRLEAGA